MDSGTIEHTFWIENLDYGALTLDTVSITGTDAADFSVIEQPDMTPEFGCTHFTVRFDPSAIGLRQAKVIFSNNDFDENPYQFSIQGTGSNTRISRFSDDFESGFSGWNILREVSWYDGLPKIGSHSIQMRGKWALVRTYSQMRKTIDTSGYSSIRVTFYMGANSLETTLGVSDEVSAWYYDGIDWHVICSIQDGEEDNQLHNWAINLPASCNDNPNFELLFEIYGDYGDYGFVDNVQVEGTQQ